MNLTITQLGLHTQSARAARPQSDVALARRLKTSVNDLKAAGFSASAYQEPLIQLCRTTDDPKAVAQAIGLVEGEAK